MLALELALISAGGIWLGLFALLALALLIYSIEKDSSMLGSAVLIATFAIAEFGFNIPIWASIIANPFMIIFYLLVYIAIGSLYAAVWRLPAFLKKNSDRIQSDYNNWKQTDRWGSTANKKDISFDAFLNSNSYNYKIKDNKERAVSWVMLWPAGVLWELTHKPFRWVWNTTYYGLGSALERINRDTARKILEDKNK
jgi:hypothetical protein